LAIAIELYALACYGESQAKFDQIDKDFGDYLAQYGGQIEEYRTKTLK
jgi:hypothetical protein